MASQWIAIRIGLYFDAAFIFLLLLPHLAENFYPDLGSPSKTGEAEHVIGALSVDVCVFMILLMGGFGITRFLGFARKDKYRYLLLGVYLFPILVLWALVEIAAVYAHLI